jgi:hypothetical protein
MAIPPDSNWNDPEYLEAVNSDATIPHKPKQVTSGYMQIVDEDGNPVHDQPETELTVTPAPHSSMQSTTHVSLPALKDGDWCAEGR